MPCAWTFSIKPIRTLLEEEVHGYWVDPFCGRFSPANVKNDLNKDMVAESHTDATEFLRSLGDGSFDGILLDPPYSNRQISEHYGKAGIKVTGWHTSSGWGKVLKDEAARVLRVGGKAICFGWNSSGLGTKRGFRLEQILLVSHGGSRNDTIVTVETKLSNKKV